MSFIIPDGDSKAEYVRQKFSGIAGRYDLFNDLITQGMHRYWKRFLVAKTGIQPGGKALDICCGTGDITSLLEKKAGREGVVTGLDFSNGMLAVAAQRNAANNVSFIRGDASVLPFASESLDTVTVGYGLRNLVSIDTCLGEVYRVLKKGGRFLSLDMGKVKLPVARQLFAFYFFRIVPRIGKLIYPGENMFDYFPESSVEFPSQEKLAGMMERQGFIDVRFYNFYLGCVAIHCGEK